MENDPNKGAYQHKRFDLNEKYDLKYFPTTSSEFKLGSLSKSLKFYITEGERIIQQQVGVMKVNCLDELDSANALLSNFAVNSFSSQYQAFKDMQLINSDQAEMSNSKNRSGKSGQDLISNIVIEKLKALWEENEHMISLQTSELGKSEDYKF